MDRILTFVIVFLIPLIPALLVGLKTGSRTRADGKVFGINFNATGASGTYFVSLAFAYVGYLYIVPSPPKDVVATRPKGYALMLDLKGDNKVKEEFLQNYLKGFRVSFGTDANDQIDFSDFRPSGSSIASTFVPKSTLSENRLSLLQYFPKQTATFTIKLADVPTRLRERMNGALSFEAINSDPFRQDVDFAKDNWVSTFQWIHDAISGDTGDHAEVMDHVVVLRNESKKKLSAFVFPGYSFDGEVITFEGNARLLPGAVLEAATGIELRGNPLLNGFDTDEIVKRLRSLATRLTDSGTEIGYFKDVNGTLGDKKRSERFSLGGNRTLVRGDPIPVEPGDAVVAVMRIEVRRFKETVEPGRSDHAGTFMYYPGRLLYLTVENTSRDVRIGETTSRVVIDSNDGTKSVPHDETKFRRRGRYLVYTDWLLDVATRPQVEWVWEKRVNVQ